MKTLVKISLALFFVLLISVTTLSQDIRYNGPRGDDSFFPIGWSGDGTHFAYGWFLKTQAISRGSQITIKIQNLVTDEVVYYGGGTWDEGNGGPGLEQYYPRSAEEAWGKVAENVNKKFVELDIWEGAGAGVLPFPMEESHPISIEVRENKEENGVGIYAVSEELGEKMISGYDWTLPSQIYIAGYVWNPSGTRIGVIITKETASPYPETLVIGCHVKAGFKKMER